MSFAFKFNLYAYFYPLRLLKHLEASNCPSLPSYREFSRACRLREMESF